MKKIFIWALMATLLVAGSAFAAGSARRLTAEPNATFAFGVGGAAAGPTTTNNDDTCDIGVAPAATLLLPYFEVDINATANVATQTLFTVTNVSEYPQIAHVTVWTDLTVPVLDFNIFLTGYDTQSINLYDVIARGIIAPTSATTGGTSSSTARGTGPGGLIINQANTANPNFSAAGINCGTLPGNIPLNILTDLRAALTTGTGLALTCTPATRVGNTHTNAIGYVTVDVASNCSQQLPSQPSYYFTDILYDNVLIGDYQQVSPNPATGNFAGGNPMVHIRAIPEGGPAGELPAAGVSATNLPYTFYSRWLATSGGVTPPQGFDRRQPLPHVFAPRWISQGAQAFNTNYKIFREGVTTSTNVCSATLNNTAIAEIVRFDEHENFLTFSTGIIISPPVSTTITLPETSSTSVDNTGFFPPASFATGDVAGWMYLNLDNLNTTSDVGLNGADLTQHPAFGNRPSQNWVIVSASAEGRYSVDFDAAWLGNGCSALVGVSEANGGATPIGPVGGVFVCPPGFTGACTPGVGAYTGTNVTP